MVFVQKRMAAERVEFTTEDRKKIVGSYFRGTSKKKAIILLHMMPATKESWNKFAKLLKKDGYHALAIDMRGHGESRRDDLDYKEFTDEDHQSTISDVYGAKEFLLKKGVNKDYIKIGGASIGANLSLQFMSENSVIKKGFMLSPGIDYKGVKAIPLSEKLDQGQKIFVAASDDDDKVLGSATEQGRALCNSIQKKCTMKSYKIGGHGTDLFESHPELMNDLINWLNK